MVAIIIPGQYGPVVAGGAGSSEETETTSWVAAVVGDGGSVSSTQRTRVNTLIVDLKAASLWTGLRRLWLYAGESSASQAKIDIKNLSSHSVTSAPVLAAGGYTGDAVDDFINTNFNIRNDWPNTDNASFGAYVRTNRTTQEVKTSMGCAIVAIVCQLNPCTFQGGGGCNYQINSGAGNTWNSGTTAQGFWTVSRTSSTAVELYRNGSSVETVSQSSGTPDNGTMYVLASNGGGVGGNFSDDQHSAVFIADGLNDTQAAALSTALNTYMTAWSVNVY